jgi:hypothetical protein
LARSGGAPSQSTIAAASLVSSSKPPPHPHNFQVAFVFLLVAKKKARS